MLQKLSALTFHMELIVLTPTVIPAQAGIQSCKSVTAKHHQKTISSFLDSRLRGNDVAR